ncbi:MAG TPA: GntR family transcriptional regulator [Candidatus Limnocylindrales bacterium]|nr:GntR family transcriptional regulator [Candidatus Limnocylindrales bacterium]
MTVARQTDTGPASLERPSEPTAEGFAPNALTAEEIATNALRQAILEGRLAPGERLRQEVLAAKLGVSRIPLRDAFRRLAAEGLIQIDGRRGARVASLSIDDVAELYELRMMLEIHCIRLAIRNLTDEGAAALLALADQMDIQAGHDAPGVISRRGFYTELYRWSGRRRMATLIIQLRHELNRYHALKNVPLSPEIHRQIRECIAARDPERAARVMREHLRTSRSALLAVLRRESRQRGRRTRRRASPLRAR